MQAVILTNQTEPNSVLGGKAGHVLWLLKNGFRVPETWVIPAGAD